MSIHKILLINYEFPPLGGGGGHACEQLSKELVQKGYDVSVLTSRHKSLVNHEERYGIQVIRIPTLRRDIEKCSVFEMFTFMISSLFYAVKFCLKNKPDIVISFFSIPCGPAALLLKLIFKTPYIVALRGGDVPGFLPEQLALFHKLTGWLTRLVWWQAKAVTTNSAGLADIAKRFYQVQTLSVIPNGVDARFFYERSESISIPPQSHLEVLSVGRLGPQKKIARLIEAIQALKLKGFDKIKLKIVGDGPEREKLEAMTQDYGLLGTQITFTGWCERDALMQHYHEASVFSLASDFEGMPNVVLEAMASSLAIVAVQSPGTVELVKNGVNGFIFKADTRGFEKYWQELQADSQMLKRMQIQSFQNVQSYTWHNVAEGYEGLWTD